MGVASSTVAPGARQAACVQELQEALETMRIALEVDYIYVPGKFYTLKDVQAVRVGRFARRYGIVAAEHVLANLNRELDYDDVALKLLQRLVAERAEKLLDEFGSRRDQKKYIKNLAKEIMPEDERLLTFRQLHAMKLQNEGMLLSKMAASADKLVVSVRGQIKVPDVIVDRELLEADILLMLIRARQGVPCEELVDYPLPPEDPHEHYLWHQLRHMRQTLLLELGQATTPIASITIEAQILGIDSATRALQWLRTRELVSNDEALERNSLAVMLLNVMRDEDSTIEPVEELALTLKDFGVAGIKTLRV